MRLLGATAMAVILLGVTGAGCLSSPTFAVEPDAAPPPAKEDPADAGGVPAEGGGGDDATMAPPSCPAKCVNAGGTCDGATCVIGCAGPGTCKDKNVRCPPGMACRVTCSGAKACDAVHCEGATECSITCEGGPGACKDLTSDAPTTSITCSGEKACDGRITCKGDTCASTCGGNGCKDVHCCALTSCTLDGVLRVCMP